MQTGQPPISDLRARWEVRYRTGPTPWDTKITPPEVVAFWQSGALAPTGLAIDLGCGTATNVAYLAGLGLFAVGIDISYEALRRGQTWLRKNHLGPEQAALLQGDVTRLPFAPGQAAYILDVGCFHAVPDEKRQDYAQGVMAALRPGGYYQLYAFDRQPASPDGRGPLGLTEHEVAERFTPALEVVSIQQAQPDPRPCRWYLLRKPVACVDFTG
ncbi:MAG: methyltransferase domain-containing protein [Caldilineae bacterium]|nr:MAG: methyltransferase domain-containing protein [Caldilineae bacterium]